MLATWARGNLDVSMTIAVGVLGQAMLVVSGILVARSLGVENRGHLALVVLVPTMLGQLSSLGLPLSATYFLSQESGAGRAILSACARLQRNVSLLTVALHLVLVFIAFRGQSSVFWAATTTILAAPGIVSQMYGLAILQGLQRFRLFNILRLVQLTVYLLGILLLFALGSNSLLLVTVSWVGSTVLAGAITLAFSMSKLGGNTAGPRRSELVRFGIKGLPGQISLLETWRLDYLALGILAGPASLGIYVVATAFANLPRFVAQGVGMVAYPKVASAPWAEAKRRTISYSAATLILSCLIVGALEAMVPVALPLLFGDAFSGAVAVARVVLIAAFFFSLRRILNDSLRGLGRPQYGWAAEIVGLAVLGPAALLLVPRWNELGMAWALVLSSGCNLTVLALATARTLLDRRNEGAYARGGAEVWPSP